MATAIVNGKLLGLIDIQPRTNLRPYEAVILLHPDTPEAEQTALFKKNKGIIEEMFKGSVHSLDVWGKRTLANPINKLNRAIYFHTTFMAEPSAVAELERTMRINDHVVRFMHTRLNETVNLAKYMEDFKTALVEAANREREREAKFQARRAARAAGRDFGGGGRRDDRSFRDDEMGGGAEDGME
jgi:small subunit ribosomal protein S6